jgi:hypothetical protein
LLGLQRCVENAHPGVAGELLGQLGREAKDSLACDVVSLWDQGQDALGDAVIAS